MFAVQFVKTVPCECILCQGGFTRPKLMINSTHSWAQWNAIFSDL